MTGHLETGGGQPRTSHSAGHRPTAFIWTISAVMAFVGVATIFAALAVRGGDNEPGGPYAVAGAITTPVATTEAPTATPAVAGATEAATETPGSTATATSSIAVTPRATASSVSATPTVGDAISISPLSPTPVVSNLTPAASALARSIASQFGVRIVTGGQDWGADGDLQLRNIGAVGVALAGLPESVRTTVNAERPLTFLSNHTGATEAGWEPYGQREANYYSNEDVSTSGRVAANQVVLQPGSNSQTIAHEIMHAYQMRDVDPGQYALALLTREMKSFMAATGWTQRGSDDDVRNAANDGWTAINSMFTYNGRSLDYTNQFGDAMSLYIPNPIEAYAEAGGLYYGHDAGIELPDWPEYWDWFQANTG